MYLFIAVSFSQTGCNCVRVCASWVRGCVGAWVRGCVGAWVRGCVGAWVRGCVGAWVRGCVGAWVRGCVGAWVRACVRGCAGARVRGCAGARVRAFNALSDVFYHGSPVEDFTPRRIASISVVKSVMVSHPCCEERHGVSCSRRNKTNIRC